MIYYTVFLTILININLYIRNNISTKQKSKKKMIKIPTKLTDKSKRLVEGYVTMKNEDKTQLESIYFEVTYIGADNEQSENKIEKTIPFTIVSNKIHKNKFIEGIKFIL